MARLRKMLGTAAAACAAMTLLAGAALAGTHTPASPTGKPATPPGQAKKGTTGKGSINGHAAKAKARGKVSVRTHPSHPAHPSHPVTPSQPLTATVSSQATVHGQSALHKPAFASTKGKGHEKTAQHKVIICHRTGSATNPYVIINVSINAWLNGHTKHPALDGRSDILLKDPAAPGEKADPALAAKCGAAAPAAAVAAAAQPASHVSARAKNRSSAGGVKGVSSTKPARQPRAAGVLGAISTPVRNANLPFTGFPLWIAALLAALFIGSGLLIRRLGRAS